ncbi:MAG: hypothetical protein NTY62_02490 [Euryarchaeota archaeon]|nr:hypothetical protein [Euryarchaeota archaeon]
MPASGRVLEDSIRLSKIRKTKLTLYIVQAVMLVALAFILVFVVGGATLKPHLYLPFDSFLAVVVLLLLIICIESFFFRILEIRFARSTSARHLMAKNSIKRSLIIAIVAGIAVVILGVPSILGGIESTGSKTLSLSTRADPPSFFSSDPFALTKTAEIKVQSTRVVQVYLLDEKIFSQYYYSEDSMTLMYYYRLNRDPGSYIVNQELTITIPNEAGHKKYYLVLNDMDNPGTSATATIERDLSGTFTGTMTLLLIALVVTNIAWVAYLVPIERKYSSGSIYK